MLFARGSQGGAPVQPGPSWEERWRAIVGDDEVDLRPAPPPPLPRRAAPRPRRSNSTAADAAAPPGGGGGGGSSRNRPPPSPAAQQPQAARRNSSGVRGGRGAARPPQPAALQRGQSAGQGLPPAVLEDLEDYFDRLDAAHYRDGAEAGVAVGAGAEGGAPAEAVSVPRFSPEDFERLLVFSKECRAAASQPPSPVAAAGAAPGLLAVVGASAVAEGGGSEDASECHICLDALGHNARDQVCVPCPARHRFHKRCLRNWLARSVQCPVCRADILAPLPAAPPATPTVQPTIRRGRSAPPPTTGGGPRTRAGGRVVRYEANPPASWPRPAYIPTHLAHLAQYLEVSYVGQGSARIWRVPRAAQADLSSALPPQ